jgi:hypothetical protein
MMNERIKQLAEQANINFSRVVILDGDPNGSAIMVGYSNIEKFAQLIVAECASRVTGRQPDHWGNMTDEIINECIIECATDLKQHFGVEL